MRLKAELRAAAVLVAVLGLLAVSPAASDALPPLPGGLPPVTTIDLPADAEQWRFPLAVSPEGFLHIGGAKGVHTFNGRLWSFWPSPNGQLMRSLVHDGERRLYVGGVDHFGYLEPDVTGDLIYSNLSDQLGQFELDERIGDVWEILVNGDEVFFNSDRHLFRYEVESRSLEMWRHDDRFGAQALVDGQVIVQFRGAGLKAYNDGEFRLIPGGDHFTEQVYHLLPLKAGGLLMTRRDGHWDRLRNGKVERLAMPEGTPGSDQVTAALVLEDGSVALGGQDGRLFLLDPKISSVRIFEIAHDFIAALARSPHGGLFVQSLSETLHVSWPSRWLRIGPESGLSGRMAGVTVFDGLWLVYGASGAHLSFVMDSREEQVRFERAPWSRFEGWDWLALDEQTALYAGSYHLLEVTPESARPVDGGDLYPKLIRESRYRPGTFLVGGDYGLSVFEHSDGQWAFHPILDELVDIVHGMEEIAPGVVLMATGALGLMRIELDPDYHGLVSARNIAADEGLDYGDRMQAQVTQLDGRGVVASTSAGIFVFDGDRFHRDDLDGLELLRDQNELAALYQGPDGGWWALTNKRLFRRPPAGAWRVENVMQLNPGILSSVNFIGERVIVGGTATLLLFDPDIAPPVGRPVSVQLTAVTHRRRDEAETVRLPLDGSQVIQGDVEDFFRFEFALPEYERPDLAAVRYRLVGFEDQFSDWRQASRVTYSRLSPGSYRLEVEARDPAGRVSRIDPFEFAVLPPWYRTGWAWVVWIALGLIMAAVLLQLLVRRRLGRAYAEQLRLGQMVEQRTAELAAANRKLRNMAHIDGLTSVPNRRRLDEYLEGVWVRCRDHDRPLGVALIDVDHFKRYNDSHGHQAGDEVLKRVADIISSELRRAEDIVARYGGEEFICILPGADTDVLRTVGESIRARIEAMPLSITVSAGVASGVPQHAGDVEKIIEQADRALYQAKRDGRNRVRG